MLEHAKATDFDPIEYINTPRWQQSRLGLSRIRSLMQKLGNPENNLRFVHVAGTNGKGSVCAFIEGCLRVAGFKTGLFTSPYIERFEERIRVNGQNISAADLLEVTLEVREAACAVEEECGEHPTEFELMCAVALVYFARVKCDICIMEVGMGGRLDSTNVIVPEVCVITRIGLDHTDILGNTLAEIAGEKAGIIKAHVPVVSYPQAPEAMQVIEKTCEKQGCKLLVSDFSELQTCKVNLQEGTRGFSYRGVPYSTSLLGSYQPENAAIAVDALCVLSQSGWKISQQQIQRGIASTVWPGRFEILSTDPLFIIDGAHNPDGVRALAASLEELLNEEPNEDQIQFVMGVLADKDYREMLCALKPLQQRVRMSFITYTPNNPRALSKEDLANAIAEVLSISEVRTANSAEEAALLALQNAAQKKNAQAMTCAFGTLYSISEIKKALSH